MPQIGFTFIQYISIIYFTMLHISNILWFTLGFQNKRVVI